MWLVLATFGTTLTDSRIQRRNRSPQTTDRAAAGTQPKSSARGVVSETSPRVLAVRARATEV
jgi:hypothetical protein